MSPFQMSLQILLLSQGKLSQYLFLKSANITPLNSIPEKVVGMTMWLPTSHQRITTTWPHVSVEEGTLVNRCNEQNMAPAGAHNAKKH